MPESAPIPLQGTLQADLPYVLAAVAKCPRHVSSPVDLVASVDLERINVAVCAPQLTAHLQLTVAQWSALVVEVTQQLSAALADVDRGPLQ